MKTLSSLVYLDSSFIILAYEILTNSPVPFEVMKTEDVKAGLSVGFANAGATTTETKKFPTSSYSMYEKIKKNLEKYESIDLDTTDLNWFPEYFWTDSHFTIGSTKVTNPKGKITHEQNYFRLKGEEKEIRLAANGMYFTSGFDMVSTHFPGISKGFSIKTRSFCRFLAPLSSNAAPLCAPLIIEKSKS